MSPETTMPPPSCLISLKTKSIIGKRQRQQQPKSLVKRQRKEGETTDEKSLSEHPPTSITQLCKPPCDLNATVQQQQQQQKQQDNKRKSDHRTLESKQKRQRKGGQTTDISLCKKSLLERPSQFCNTLCDLNTTRQQQHSKRKRDHQPFGSKQKRHNQAQQKILVQMSATALVQMSAIALVSTEQSGTMRGTYF
ncbi:unnamed protein product [Absidia cylindrospora]